MQEEKLITEINNVVEQLEILINYIDDKCPVLSKAGNLGKKDCFALNSLMKDKVDVSEATKTMQQYPSLYFWYNILKGLNLYNEVSLSSTKRIFKQNEAYKIYEQLSVVEKYIVILHAYLEEIEVEQLYGHSAIYIGMIENQVSETLEDLISLNIDEEISINWAENKLYKVPHKYEYTFSTAWKLFYSFKSLGLCEIELVENKGFYSDGEKTLISSMRPTYLGQIVLKDILDNKCLQMFLRKDIQVIDDYYRLIQDENSFFEEILGLSKKDLSKCENDKNAIKNEERSFARTLEKVLKSEIKSDKIMSFTNAGTAVGTDCSYILKVEFKAAPSTWVRFQVDGQATLDDLSNAILKAIGFDDDHLYAFYMDNKPWSNNAYYGPGANQEGERPAGEVKLNVLKLKVNKRFAYLYDFGDEWVFTIYCEQIVESKVKGITVLESHGKEIEQYPNWGDDWE